MAEAVVSDEQERVARGLAEAEAHLRTIDDEAEAELARISEDGLRKRRDIAEGHAAKRRDAQAALKAGVERGSPAPTGTSEASERGSPAGSPVEPKQTEFEDAIVIFVICGCLAAAAVGWALDTFGALGILVFVSFAATVGLKRSSLTPCAQMGSKYAAALAKASTIAEALEAWGLSEYGEQLEKLGYDLEVLGDISASDLEEMFRLISCKPGHKVKFRALIKKDLKGQAHPK